MAISRYRSHRRAARRVAAVVAVTMAMAALGACGGSSGSADAAGLVDKMKKAGIKCLDVQPRVLEGPDWTTHAACGIALPDSASASDGIDPYGSDDAFVFTVATYSDDANTDEAVDAEKSSCELIRGSNFIVVGPQFMRVATAITSAGGDGIADADTSPPPDYQIARESGKKIADAIDGEVVNDCEPPS